MIKLKNISKLYGNKVAVENANFIIEKNKINCFIGRNGAGKTTLIKILLEQVNSSSGSISYDELIQKHEISYLAEERGLYSKNTVLENITYFCDLSGTKNIKERVNEVLKEFEIEKYRNTKVSALSKGNAQKVQLACVFAPKSKMIILDEPFSGLDYINALKLAQIIKKYAKDLYMLISTHQMKFVDDFAQNILVINNGNVLFNGHVDDLKKHSKIYLQIEKTSENKILLEKQQLEYKEFEQKYLISNITKTAVINLVMQHFETFTYDYLKTSDIIIEMLGESYE